MTAPTSSSLLLPLAAALLAATAPVRAAVAQAPSAPAASAPAAPAKDIPKGMTQYFVVLYVKGEKWIGEPSPAQLALVRDHLAYVRRNIEARKYVFAGPMLDGATARAQGIIVLAAPNAEEARRLVSDDPSVRAGHFAVELHPALLPSLAGVDVRY